MALAGRSHIGLLRKDNEDDYYCDGYNRYFIIADGIGGHFNGRIASKIAVNTVKQYIEENIEALSSEKILENAFKLANDVVFAYQQNQGEGRLMGTTLTVCIVNENQVHFGHIGDSRGYILHMEDIEPFQFTQDHTYFAELANHEIVNEDSVVKNKKNTLLRAIGPEPVCIPQIGTFELSTNDMVFLLTDGMYRYISLGEMKEIINYTDNLDEITQRFEQLALERGGKDNATMVLYYGGR